MNSYEIKIIQGNQVVSQGFSQGSSACEALENGVRQSSVFTPSGNDESLALVRDQSTGLVFKFEIGVAF